MTMFRVSGLPKSAFMNLSKYTLMLCSSSNNAARTCSALMASSSAAFCSSSCISLSVTESLRTPFSMTFSRFAVDFSTSRRLASKPSR